MTNYEDIINLPHHISKAYPQMSVINRAAQFSPFAALTGYGDAVKETSRLTDVRRELDEYEKAAIGDKLQLLADIIDEKPEISISYFLPDDKKSGGKYITVSGQIKKIDDFEGVVCMADKTKIIIEEIIEIKGDILKTVFGE